MSSHREAPEISKDPVADGTDTYAFVSPDKPGYVTLIANFIPLQPPDGGPNFYEFGDDVAYDIKIANSGKGKADIVYRFQFTTKIRNPKTFLYNTGPITSIDSPNWNRPQYYSVTRIEGGHTKLLGKNLACPPVNVGKRSTPNYAALAGQAVHTLGNRKVFAGQRADAFHVDLGSIFDLGALRPFNQRAPDLDARHHRGQRAAGVQRAHDRAAGADLRPEPQRRHPQGREQGQRRHRRVGDGEPAASRGCGTRRRAATSATARGSRSRGSATRCSTRCSCRWPRRTSGTSWSRSADSAFAKYVNKPELQGLLPALYPGVFPKLAAYTKSRADLNAILLTGIPSGVVAGFQNYTGPVESDMLRLNLAIPPTKKPNNGGLVAGDAAGFPNGRRIDDDVVTIELRAIAGATIPLVDPSYTPDGAASAITDGTTNTNARCWLASRTSAFPVVGTRPCPAPRRRHERDGHRGREPVRRAGLGPARHRGRHRCGRGRDAGRDGGRRGRDPARRSRPISTRTGTCHHPHVAVVNRPVEGGQLPSLVFPEVREGTYGLYLKESAVRRLTVTVAGGQVTSAEWPR